MRKDDWMSKRIYVDLSDEKSGVTGTCQLLDMYFPEKICGADGYTSNIAGIVDCGSFQGEDDDELLNSSFNFDVTKPEFGTLLQLKMDFRLLYSQHMLQKHF